MVNSRLPRLCGWVGVGGFWGGLTSQVTPKSHDTSRDSLFILKHATDFTGRMFIKANPLRMK